MVIEELIHPDDKAAVMRALLLRHRHVNDHSHGSFHFGARRKYSSYSSLQVKINIETKIGLKSRTYLLVGRVNIHSAIRRLKCCCCGSRLA
jgi:Band 3 cytoplasmic domain